MHFDLASVPDGHRTEMLHDVVGRVLANSGLNPLDERPEFELSIWALPQVAISQARCSPHRVVGGLDPSRRDDDLIFTWCYSDAPSYMRQNGKEARTDLGRAALITSAEPLLAHNEADISIKAIKVDRNLLRSFVSDSCLGLMSEVGRDVPAFSILRSYVDCLAHTPLPEDQLLQQEVATHICELISLSLIDANRRTETDALPARLLFPAIKRWIQRRMHSPELTIGKLSCAFGLSERTLQLLFREEGTTFTRHLKQVRLAYAFDRLASPTDAQSVTSIAFESGFADLSYFNRSFRAQFGATPSELRKGGTSTE